MNGRIVPHLFSVSLLSRVPQNKPRTSHPQESHDVVLSREIVPSSGELDVSEQLTNGQSENFRVVTVLWCDSQCVRSQLLVKICRAC